MSSLAVKPSTSSARATSDAGQLARGDVRVPLDLLANISLDAGQPPAEWRAIFAHAGLRDAVGKEDDAIFALYVEAGEADDAVAPALRPHFSLLNTAPRLQAG